MKKLKKIIITIVVILLLILILGSNYFFEIALTKKAFKGDIANQENSSVKKGLQD